MKVPKDDEETRRVLEERAATLRCINIVKAARERLPKHATLHNITDGGSAAPHSHTSDGLLGMPTMEWIIGFTAERLEKLLHIWKNCPSQAREWLAPGVPQLEEMSTKAVNYKGTRYSCLFFGFMCDANICLLEKGDPIDFSMLQTAWNGFRLSVHVVNDPSSYDRLKPVVVQSIQESGDLLRTFDKRREENQSSPEKWILKINLQQLCYKGMLLPLQRLAQELSEETLAAELMDLDDKFRAYSNKLSIITAKERLQV